MQIKTSIACRWQFHTKEHDIRFGVYLCEESGKEAVAAMTPIQQLERVQCDVDPQEGALECKEQGLCKRLYCVMCGRRNTYM